MKHSAAIVVLLLGIAGFLNAQPEASVPKLTVKLGALSLIDPVLPSFNLAGEFQISGRWYGQMEAGLILNLEDQVDGLRTGDKSGFRLRPAVRFYYQEQRNRYFLEFLLVYRQVSMDIDGEFWIAPPNELSYNRLVNYSVDSRKLSAFLNVGLFDHSFNERLLVELGMGLGLTGQDNSFSNIPDYGSLRRTSIFSGAFDPDYAINTADIRVTGMLYLNIGYVLF
ncbi:hypothetical protein [Phaeodactylibacter xiamenensis]|jgi:hypothetical protein|uniref:hypothetical protein n=1 Tax=Phaeodactylibacter xiamenensis TaxID=1524460 RepID=UPI0024A93C87|nr:hypothetical protein [Phaeodactylibacter xiamenensis]